MFKNYAENVRISQDTSGCSRKTKGDQITQASGGKNANKLDKIQKEKLWEDRNSRHGTLK
jgi:hypothetical protein